MRRYAGIDDTGDSIRLRWRTLLQLGGVSLFRFRGAQFSHAQVLTTSTKEFAMEITRVGSRPSAKGPEDWFTGAVRIDPLFSVKSTTRAAGNSVTFEPGARTAWHTHPLGQTLIISSGCGWVQQEGGPIEEVRAGDVIWFPPGVKHWHGATPTTAMTHIAIQEALEGKMVDWLEKVSEEQYRR